MALRAKNSLPRNRDLVPKAPIKSLLDVFPSPSLAQNDLGLLGRGGTELIDILHFYQLHTARQLGGNSHDAVWETLVLQVGEQEPCIRQMTLAITCLHVHLETRFTDGENPGQGSVLTYWNHSEGGDLRNRAIGHYGQAIRLLNEHMELSGWSSLEVTVLCAIMCVQFEWWVGDYTAAMMHLRSSVGILRQWQAEGRRANSGVYSLPATSLLSPGGRLIQTMLRPLFTKLILQAASAPPSDSLWLLAVDNGQLPRQEPVLAIEVTTFEEARDRLYEVLSNEYLHAASYVLQQGTSAGPVDLGSLIPAGRSSAPRDLSSVSPARILLLFRHMAAMHVARRKSVDESVYESLQPSFAATIDIAETLSASPPQGRITTVWADACVVPVLYFVIRKCRDSRLRLRAVDLLRVLAGRREGVWGATWAARMALEMVEDEMEGGAESSETGMPGRLSMRRIRGGCWY